MATTFHILRIVIYKPFQMKPASISFTKIGLAFIVWLICIIKIYISYDHETLMNVLMQPAFICAASITSLVILYSDNKRYKKTQHIASFSGTMASAIGIGLLLLTFWLLKLQDKSPSVLFAQSSRKLTYTSIDLRENKTFKITSSRLFEKDYIRGRYLIKNGQIILHNANLQDVLPSHIFISRTFPIPDSIKNADRKLLNSLFSDPSDTLPRTYLIPVDGQGKVIDSGKLFHVFWNTAFN